MRATFWSFDRGHRPLLPECLGVLDKPQSRECGMAWMEADTARQV
jgi:hypothetical protein